MSAVEVELPVRTEVEVAANAVWSLFAEGLLEKTPTLARRAADAAGLSVDDLRLASVRHDRAPRRTRPHLRAVVPGEPEVVPPDRSTRTPGQQNTRTCLKCKVTKTLDLFGPKSGQRNVKSQWCRECANGLSERMVQTIRAGESALVRLALYDGDECVGMACARCSHPLQVGDVMVVAAAPEHEHCPA